MLTALEYIINLFNTFAAYLADMHKTVCSGHNLNECSEVHYVGYDSVIYLSELWFSC